MPRPKPPPDGPGGPPTATERAQYAGPRRPRHDPRSRPPPRPRPAGTRILAVMNQKGGVGKTTSSVNLAAGLADEGRRTLLVDLDPQGHASLHLGLEPVGSEPTVYDVFRGDLPVGRCVRKIDRDLHVLPANLDLAAAELELVDAPNRETVLRTALTRYLAEADERGEPYDFVIFDCPAEPRRADGQRPGLRDRSPHPPATALLRPCRACPSCFQTTALVARRLNRGLRVSGVALCMYEQGTPAGGGRLRGPHRLPRRGGPVGPVGGRGDLPHAGPAEHQAGPRPPASASRSSATPAAVRGRRTTPR